jgi:uncharacterized protein
MTGPLLLGERFAASGHPRYRGLGMSTLHDKYARLQEVLRGLDTVLIAYSGGVDSAYLAWAAHQALGEKMLAVIADSPSLARSHFTDAVAFAKSHDIPLTIIKTVEMENPEYVRNDTQRCYFCKSELFTKMEDAQKRLGFQHLAYGMNLDDRGDFRPGQKAATQHAVLAPLVEAGLTKADIRALAREADLQVWDKPASACLSSRIAYGNPVTEATLLRIEQAEDYLRQLGFRQFRVRDHGGLARIEIAPEEMERILSANLLLKLAPEFKRLGFQFVTLDCEGYRTGSMNPVTVTGAA